MAEASGVVASGMGRDGLAVSDVDGIGVVASDRAPDSGLAPELVASGRQEKTCDAKLSCSL